MNEQRDLKVAGKPTTLHLATPDEAAPQAGVIVLHPWWGRNADVLAYADRLAETGFAVAAPDLFAGQIATTIEDADRLSSTVNEDVADATVLAAVDELGGAIGDPSARIGAVGFSFGGAWALWLPAQRPEVRATVVYYGSIEGPSLTRARTPVLGHFAETDPYETDEGVAAFERTLRTAGRDVEIQRYPGTGHWFAEPSKDAYAPDAAELAFSRTIAFLRRHLLDGD
ncbi:MAG TPA: dienelactone hydrolase family protein [Candidatus Limnocylindrales bacterium]|nr:dienelactone hydrolase family protein [Candidatus Limnocylindrales bacterium]